MLKAVLKKSREGGKGSRKETGMYKQVAVGQQLLLTLGWEDAIALGMGPKSVLGWNAHNTGSYEKRKRFLSFLMGSDFEN